MIARCCLAVLLTGGLAGCGASYDRDAVWIDVHDHCFGREIAAELLLNLLLHMALAAGESFESGSGHLPLEALDESQLARMKAAVQSIVVPYEIGSPEWEGYRQRLMVLRTDAQVPERYISSDSTSSFAQRWWEGHVRAEADYRRVLKAAQDP